jgi:hypothetical protein
MSSEYYTQQKIELMVEEIEWLEVEQEMEANYETAD